VTPTLESPVVQVQLPAGLPADRAHTPAPAQPDSHDHHIIELLRADGIAVDERLVVIADAWTADEAFLTGTGAEVVPVASVDGRRLAVLGPLTRRAQELFAASLPVGAAIAATRA
jgi:hypothetical protein